MRFVFCSSPAAFLHRAPPSSTTPTLRCDMAEDKDDKDLLADLDREAHDYQKVRRPRAFGYRERAREERRECVFD